MPSGILMFDFLYLHFKNICSPISLMYLLEKKQTDIMSNYLTIVFTVGVHPVLRKKLNYWSKVNKIQK